MLRNAAPINFLKISIMKKSTECPPSQSTTRVSVTANTTAAAVTTATAARMTSRDEHIHVMKTDVPRLSSTEDNDMLIQKLCSVFMRTATMQQTRREIDEMTTAKAFTIGTRGHSEFQPRFFHKKFPSLSPRNNFKSDATLKPTSRYQDPIMIQEYSLTRYSPEMGNSDVDPIQTYDEDSDQPAARKWKIVKVEDPKAESMKNDDVSDDIDDDHDHDDGDGDDK